MNLAWIPSPTTAVWHLGPVPIRAYALCIVTGIVAACLLTEVRLRRRGVPPGAVLDVAVWAVPFGVVGARIYHVLTSWQEYFGAHGDLVKALYIWEGGLGIWGGVAGGAVGAWLGCRQIGIPLTLFADALAPGLPLAQALGRFGNWFHNELYGGLTDKPWGLTVHKMFDGAATIGPDGEPLALPGHYHPTFAYEALWNVGVAGLVLAIDRRFKLGKGRAFALYVMAYTVGRFWIEMMRTDEANHILGLRLNVWTSILVFAGALIYFLRVHGPQEYVLPGTPPQPFRVVTEQEFAAGSTTSVTSESITTEPPATNGAAAASAGSDSAASASAGPDGATTAGDQAGGAEGNGG